MVVAAAVAMVVVVAAAESVDVGGGGGYRGTRGRGWRERKMVRGRGREARGE